MIASLALLAWIATLVAFSVLVTVIILAKKQHPGKNNRNLIVGAALMLIATITSFGVMLNQVTDDASSASATSSMSRVSSTTDDANATSSVSATSSSAETEVFTFGDTVEFESGASVTVYGVKAVQTTDFMDIQPGQTGVEVDAMIENTSSTPLDFNAQRFDVYDDQDEIGEFDAETYGGNIPNSIAANRKASVKLLFDVNHPGSYSVAYGDAIWAP